MAQRSVPQLRQGALAGVLAGLLQVGLLFIDNGPGYALATLARWVGANGGTGGKTLGAVLLVVLGALGGMLYAWVTRDRALTLTTALRLGLSAGAIWWVFVAGVSLIRQQPLSAYGLIYFLVLGLLYGIVLGNLTVTRPWRGGV